MGRTMSAYRNSYIFFDYFIIGGGAVGLSICEAISRKLPQKSILLIEKNHFYGDETTSRNSQVIHSGIYYSQNTLKSTLCILGKKLLYNYLKENEIPHRNIGKFIVANKKQVGLLCKIATNAKDVGVPFELISERDLKILEPNINACLALYSPSTGIFDTSCFIRSMSETLNSRNSVQTLTDCESSLIYMDKNRYRAKLRQLINKDYTEETLVECETVINASGLNAHLIFNELSKKTSYKVKYIKGQYFKYASSDKIFSKLVYPVPDLTNQTLGIHATLDMDSQLRFGPDAVDTDNVEYSVNQNDANKFTTVAQSYCKVRLDPLKVVPDYSGIRPRVIGTPYSNKYQDFVISNEKSLGFDKFVNLIGIESPGLTSCLAIAEYVCYLLGINTVHQSAFHKHKG